jgi:eukaryotic-like serine/threonine-protein kinase
MEGAHMTERDRDEESDGPVSRAPTEMLRYGRPVVDGAALEHVRERAERKLFGTAEPARLGRFLLEGPIAGGGMGMVHRAYDPQLDRSVALKLLHPALQGTGARDRLADEARVLARFRHPNVVAVHDVVELEGQLVIVMELVPGRTLSEWAEEQPRTWREIIAVYHQAGSGLAAAHAVGVIHRDFKPSNAIVGEDGRVRVLDFGLAKVDEWARTAAGQEPASADVGTGSSGLQGGAWPGGSEVSDGLPTRHRLAQTATGEVLGTLHFTAPERLAGEVATPASDQFSFCVALHCALHGLVPFVGDAPASLITEVLTGRIAHAADGRRVPGWLCALVDRGLAASPSERHPSMAALLEQLGRERGWRRWRLPILSAIAVAVASLAVLTASRRPERDPLETCDGGVAEIADAWNPALRYQVRDALARTGTPLYHDIIDRVEAGLDRYRDNWTGAHRDACRAHLRGVQSSRLLDRRMLCLNRRREDLAAAVQVLLRASPEAADSVVDLVARMPPVASCANIEALEAETDPPATNAERERVARVRTLISRANALDRGGHSHEAQEAAERALAEARRTSYPPVVVEAALLKGRVLMFQQEKEKAVPSLALAESEALANGLFSDAVVAAARRMYAEGTSYTAGPSNHDPSRLISQVAVYEPLSRSLRGDHFARPLLLNNVGTLYRTLGDREKAAGYFEAARASLDGVREPDLELTAIDINLSMLTADPTARAERACAAWLRRRDALGRYHPETIQALNNYGHVLDDPAMARRLIGESCDLYREFHRHLVRLRAPCRSYEALLAAESGHSDTAAEIYADVVRMTAGNSDEDVMWRGRLAAGHASLYGQRPAEALAHFTAAIQQSSGIPSFWGRKRIAEGRLGAGLAELALGRHEVAADHLDAAAATFAEGCTLNEDAANRRLLAVAREALARVLRKQHDSDRASELEAMIRQYREGASRLVLRLPPRCLSE